MRGIKSIFPLIERVGPWFTGHGVPWAKVSLGLPKVSDSPGGEPRFFAGGGG